MAIGPDGGCAAAFWVSDDGIEDEISAPAPITEACLINSLRLEDISFTPGNVRVQILE
jgi:hypothetical protein